LIIVRSVTIAANDIDGLDDDVATEQHTDEDRDRIVEVQYVRESNYARPRVAELTYQSGAVTRSAWS